MRYIAIKIKNLYRRISVWWLMRSIKKDLKKLDKEINEKVSRHDQSV